MKNAKKKYKNIVNQKKIEVYKPKSKIKIIRKNYQIKKAVSYLVNLQMTTYRQKKGPNQEPHIN